MMKFILWGRVIVYGLVLAVALRGLWLLRKQREIDRTGERQEVAAPPSPLPVDAEKCIANQRLAQQTMRFLQVAGNLKPGDPVPWEMIYRGGTAVSSPPSCPTDGPDAYTRATTIPEPGIQILTCGNPAHRPRDTANW